MNCTSHEFCARDIKLLDETGVDETYPTFHPALPATKERMTAFNQKNWPQRNHTLKQRLLFEGKVRSKEGEFDGAAMIVPTNAALDNWIEQSKAYGNTVTMN